MPDLDATSLIARSATRLAHYGHSFATGYGNMNGGLDPYTSSISASIMIEAMSLGRFTTAVDTNFGVFGRNLAAMVAAFDGSIGAAKDMFDLVLSDCIGANDMSTSYDAIMAAIQTLGGKIAALGKLWVLTNPFYPRSFGSPTAAQQRLMARVNLAVRAWARTQPHVIFVDVWRDLVDASVSIGFPASGVLYDGLHLTAYGAQLVAARVLDVLGPMYVRADLNQAQWDAYHQTEHPRGNIVGRTTAGRMLMQGSSEVAAAAGTGQLATGWTATRQSGAAANTEVVFSKGAASAAWGGEHQVITIASPLTTAIQQLFVLEPGPPVELRGQPVLASLEIVTEGVVGVATLSLTVQSWYGPMRVSVGHINGATGNSAYRDGRYLLRTPPFTLPADAQTLQLILGWHLALGGSGTLRFGAPCIRPI